MNNFKRYGATMKLTSFVGAIIVILLLSLSGRPVSSISSCNWTGTFEGKDTVGQEMTITLTQTEEKVSGGWQFISKGADKGKTVTATISDATLSGNALKGSWAQDKADIKSGSFEWTWLGNCDAFEGTFNGTKFWLRMARR